MVLCNVHFYPKLIKWKWETTVRGDTTLRDAAPQAYSKVQADLRNLHRNCGIDTKNGDFVHVPKTIENELLYIYRHPKHLAYSQTKSTMLASFCDLQESVCLCSPCDERHCHVGYYPYFYGNNQFKVMLAKYEDDERVAALMRKDCFGTAMPAGNYGEDQWTERLHYGLLFSGIKSELTASYGLQFAKSWKCRLPEQVDQKCLLFQGTPDIIITVRKREGILATYTEDSNEEEKTEEQVKEEDDDLPSSQESARIQISHQMNVAPYTSSSFLSDKAGKLVAALHTSLVCRALTRYVAGKEVSALTANGLFVHRAVGINHIQVTLSTASLKISAKNLVDGVGSPGLFCAALQCFTTELNKSNVHA